MATISKANRKANPMKTKNDRVRLGNFSRSALEVMCEKSTKPKEKRKIQNRINIMIKRGI